MTWPGYRQSSRLLTDDPLARRVPDAASPPVLRAAMRVWDSVGIPSSTIGLHVRTLRAAFGLAAYEQRMRDCQPPAGMHGPGQPDPRRDVTLDVIRDLLRAGDQ